MSTLTMSSAFTAPTLDRVAGGPEAYKESIGLGKLAGAAINSEWVASWAWRAANAESAYTPREDNYFAPDDKPLWKALTHDVDQEYWPEIARANNAAHALAIADNMRSVTKSRRVLQEAGMSGVAASIAAAILDPVSLAAGFGAGAVVGKAGIAAGRGARFALGGAAGVGTDGVIESYLVSQDPQRQMGDVALAVTASFALGGLGGLASGGWNKMAARAAKSDRDGIVATMGAAAGEELRPKTLGEAVTAADKAAYVRSVLESRQLPPETIDDIVADPARVDAEFGALTHEGMPGGDADAGDLGTPPPPKTPTGEGDAADDPFALPDRQLGDFDPSRASDAPAKWTRVRGSFASVLSDPRVPPTVRKAMNSLVDDVLPKAGNAASMMAASMWAHTRIHAQRVNFHKAMKFGFTEFSKATGVRGRRGLETFSRDVLNIIERPGLIDSVAPGPAKDALVATADKVAKNVFENQLGLLQRHGVPGTDRFDTNRHYVPLLLSPSKVRVMRVQAGDEAVVEFLTQALLRGSEDLDEDVARTMAKMKLKVMDGVGQFSDADRFMAFQGRQLAAVRHILESEPFETLSDDAIERIMGRIDEVAEGAEAGIPGFARRRTKWDMAYVADVPLLNGEVLRARNVRDLLYETNLFELAERYIRASTGQAALHSVYRQAAKDMGRKAPFRTRQQFENAIQEELRKAGIDTNTKTGSFGLKFMEHLQVAQKHIAGIPLFDEDKVLQKASRVLRKYNYVQRSGGFGFAQLPELGKVMGFAGVMNTVNSVPILRSFSKKFPQEMLETMEFLGLGSDYWINETLVHLDPDDLIDFNDTRLLDRAERGLTWMGRMGSFMSGFNHVNAGLQRLNTVAITHKFVTDAVGNRPWNKAKLAALGLSDTDAKRVFDAIRHEVTRGVAIKRQEGMFAKRVTAFQLSKFEDQQAAALLLDSINQFARRSVQDSSLGSSLMLMHKPWAKLMFQFQNFAVQAWEKQLLYSGATITDRNTWAAAMLGTLMGGLVYTAQQHLYSIGRADKDEFIEKRLGSPEERAMRFFQAGAQRSGNFSVLPWGVDFMAYALGYDPIFDARNTEQSFRDSGFGSVLGPSEATLGDAGRALKGAVTAARDGDDYSEGDFNALRRAFVPWQGVPILRNFLDGIGTRLGPEDPDR